MFFPSRVCVPDTKATKQPSGLRPQEVFVRAQPLQAAAAMPVSSSQVKAARTLQHLAFTPCNGIFCWRAADVDPPDHVSHPQLSRLPSQPHSVCRKGPRQRLPRGLSNAQLSFVQLSSEFSSPKNGDVRVILGSQVIFLLSRIIAPVFDAEERLCRLAVHLTAQGISELKPINHVSWWLTHSVSSFVKTSLLVV